ncbi:MAG TPA: SPASM domain-containing protein [Gaiellaceae bacterium]|nr:SPASM domain-containing protein [Gaiellaceae bacterium]
MLTVRPARSFRLLALAAAISAWALVAVGGIVRVSGVAFVSHVGDVCGCGFFPLSVGNVRERPFSELYLQAPLSEALRDPSRLGGDCGACEYRALCGGCRARAYAATGDPLAEEPDCAYEPAPRGIAHRPGCQTMSTRMTSTNALDT